MKAGDVVLVRTGNGAVWNDAEKYLNAAGMAPSASDWLAERRVLAVGADNVAWDGITKIDPDHGTLPGHTILLVKHGIFIWRTCCSRNLRHRTSMNLFLSAAR